MDLALFCLHFVQVNAVLCFANFAVSMSWENAVNDIFFFSFDESRDPATQHYLYYLTHECPK